jgi:hypothetical protein
METVMRFCNTRFLILLNGLTLCKESFYGSRLLAGSLFFFNAYFECVGPGDRFAAPKEFDILLKLFLPLMIFMACVRSGIGFCY